MSRAAPNVRIWPEHDIDEIRLRATSAQDARAAAIAPCAGLVPAAPAQEDGRIGRPAMEGSAGEGTEDASPILCPIPTPPFDPVLLERARQEYAACGRRAAALGPSTSSDPAWNILLDLLITEAAGRRLSVTDVCHGSRSSITTGARYLELLQAAGHVERVPDHVDRRRTYVRLTVSGKVTMANLLRS